MIETIKEVLTLVVITEAVVFFTVLVVGFTWIVWGLVRDFRKLHVCER